MQFTVSLASPYPFKRHGCLLHATVPLRARGSHRVAHLYSCSCASLEAEARRLEPARPPATAAIEEVVNVDAAALETSSKTATTAKAAVRERMVMEAARHAAGIVIVLAQIVSPLLLRV